MIVMGSPGLFFFFFPPAPVLALALRKLRVPEGTLPEAAVVATGLAGGGRCPGTGLGERWWLREGS